MFNIEDEEYKFILYFTIIMVVFVIVLFIITEFVSANDSNKIETMISNGISIENALCVVKSKCE